MRRVVDQRRQPEHGHDRDRLAAGAWADAGLVFTTSTGTPVDHRNDAREFKALCQRAGIPPYRGTTSGIRLRHC